MREFLVVFSAQAENVHIRCTFNLDALNFQQAEVKGWDLFFQHIIPTTGLEHQMESIIDTAFLYSEEEEEVYEEEDE